jgi:hypothetical protein
MAGTFLSENINNIISIARLAPSVHNTQPWRVHADGSDLVIEPEPKRRLAHGDPTGRETYISLGIFAESCVVALECLGYQAKVRVLNDGLIKIAAGPKMAGPPDTSDVEALKRRFTDRSVYKKVRLTHEQRAEIESAWQSKSAEIKVSDNRELISQCAELTRSGLLLALSSPDFRRELVEHLVPGNSPKGIPLNTLSGNRLLVRQLLASGLSRRAEAQKEYKRWVSASGLVFILTEGDSKPFWIEAGRAYLRASLAIQKIGFAQATSAAIVEASDFHEDIEKALGTDKRLQCLMRIGKSKSKYRPSGRFEPGQLIT